MNDTPKQLPIIKIGNKSFFKDDKLKQYRNTDNPHEFYSFEEIETVFKFLDVGGQLMTNISTVAQQLGAIVQSGQSSTLKDVLHIVTPDMELITVIRNFKPDNETLESILYDEDERPCAT